MAYLLTTIQKLLIPKENNETEKVDKYEVLKSNGLNKSKKKHKQEVCARIFIT